MSSLVLLLASFAVAGNPQYEAECEAGEAASCVLLSLMASKSKDPVERATSKTWHGKAVALFDASCAAKDKASCVKLADVWLVYGSESEAQNAWERACDLDPRGCVELADGMTSRPKIPAAIPQALLARACGHSVGLGCVGAALGAEERSEPDAVVRELYDKGVSLLTSECDHSQDVARRGQACATLGELIYSGILQASDRDRGLEYWVRGCISGVDCRSKAALLFSRGDQPASVLLLRKACSFGDCTHWEESCAGVEALGPCAPLP